jgi:hypothetical protein
MKRVAFQNGSGHDLVRVATFSRHPSRAPQLHERELHTAIPRWNEVIMQRSDVCCPKCHAGYCRLELMSSKGSKGEYHCKFCGHVLEVFDGSTEVAYRLTVQPGKILGAQKCSGEC